MRMDRPVRPPLVQLFTELLRGYAPGLVRGFTLALGLLATLQLVLAILERPGRPQQPETPQTTISPSFAQSQAVLPGQLARPSDALLVVVRRRLFGHQFSSPWVMVWPSRT